MATPKKRGRRPGRPRSGDPRPSDDERLILHVILDRELWDRLEKSVERARTKTEFRASKADVVRKLLRRALTQEEAEDSSSS